MLLDYIICAVPPAFIANFFKGGQVLSGSLELAVRAAVICKLRGKVYTKRSSHTHSRFIAF